MKNKPLVSVIINCHNSAKYLQEAIDSVFAQTYNEWEIIIINNASTDKTKEIIFSYNNDKIIYYENTQIVTLGKARKQAVNYSNGEYVAILDSDDIWLNDKLELQMELMVNNKGIGFSYSDSNVFNGDKVLFSIFKKSQPRDGLIFGSLLESVQSFISSETIIYDKKILNESNIKYNEDLHMTADYDLILRLSLNYKTKYVNKILSKCRLHSSSESQLFGNLVPKDNFIMIENILNQHPLIKKEYTKELSRFYYINTYLMSVFIRRTSGIFDTLKYLFSRKKDFSLYKLSNIYFITEIKYYFNVIRSKLINYKIKTNKL